MKKSWKAVIAGALLAAGAAPGTSRAEETLQQRLDALERRYNVLERKLENDHEASAAKAKDGASVTASAGDGFTIKSADKSFALKLTGYSQLDGRFYLHDKAGALANTFLIRRARVWLDVTLFKAVTARVVPDFGAGATALQEAYLNLNYHPTFQVRAGRFKVPFGLERLQSNNQTTFVEQAHSTSLTPCYDNGLQLWGDLGNGAFTYAVAYTNGAADGGTPDSDTADGKALTARVFVHPFRPGGSLAWKDLGIGFAASKDRLLGASTSTTTGFTAAYRTPGQQSFFTYANSIVDGDRVRWSPQAYWYPGRFGLLAEYVVSRADVRRVTAPFGQAKLTNRAWQAQGSFALTGETVTHRGLKPLKNFGTADGEGWGAWEIAARYTELAIDKATFEPGAGAATGLYANSTTQAQRARTWTGGLNWYLNPAVKVQTEYDYTQFTGGASGAGARKLGVRELLTRFQVSF